MGASPTRPGNFPVLPPVDVAAAMFPLASMATAPTVSQPGGRPEAILLEKKFN